MVLNGKHFSIKNYVNLLVKEHQNQQQGPFPDLSLEQEIANKTHEFHNLCLDAAIAIYIGKDPMILDY